MVGIRGSRTFIVSGEIGELVTGRDVLAMVLGNKSVDFGNLHISSADGIEGDIAVYQATYVIGAKVAGKDLSGWDALKLLLDTKSGSFSYVEHHLQSQCRPKSDLKVRLTDLITLWPTYPATAEQMKCGRTSFNRIMAFSGTQQSDMEPHFFELTKASIKRILQHS